MKIEIEISEDYIKAVLESAVTDFVYDHAKRFVDVAIAKETDWGLDARVRLAEEINDSVKAHLRLQE